MAGQPEPDLVLHGGSVLTVDAAFTVAEAIAIRDGRVLAVGDSREIRRLGGDRTEEIALEGRTVIPGLIDGHAHMDREGLKELCPSLAGARSVADVLDRVAALVREAGPGEWIVTMPLGDPPHYWNAPQGLAEGRYPTRAELDRAAPDNPVYIRPHWGYWRHAPRPETLVSVANSRALDAAGIDRNTPAPAETVVIELDPDGELSGRFVERASTSLVELVLFARAPRFTSSQREAGLKRAMAIYNSFGTTSVFEGHGVAPEVLDAYKSVRRSCAQTVRGHLAFSPSWSTVGMADTDRFVAAWLGAFAAPGMGDAWLRLEGMFLEIGGRPDQIAQATAAPYTGWAGFHYDCGLAREQLPAVLASCARHGVRVFGLSLAFLDLFDAVDREFPLAGRRWAIEHPGIFTPAQIDSLARLGVIVTPLTGRYIHKEGNAPGNEAGNPADVTFMPLRSLLAAGVGVALETDNVPPSMFPSLWHAVARRDRFGNPVLPDSERISRAEALRAATMGGAHLVLREDELGSLEPGKLADLAVLSDDYLRCPEDALRDLVAEITVVDGRVVHSVRP
ncbi:MAG: amidohydrolase [Rhodospirillaceae bacterium]